MSPTDTIFMTKIYFLATYIYILYFNAGGVSNERSPPAYVYISSIHTVKIGVLQ